MRLRELLLSTALIALAHPASAQVANSFCASNPAACGAVAPAYANGGVYGGGYGGYAPTGYVAPAYAGYGGNGGYGGYGGYGGNGGYGPGYGGGYPPPGYYGPGGAAQAQSLGAIANAPGIMPGQYGQQPFPPNQASQAPAPTAPPHPANSDFSRYSAGIFSDANRPSKVVQRTARSAGIRDGYAQESRRIAEYLSDSGLSQRLDAKYPFASQMVGSSIVPPVITELGVVRRNPTRTLVVTTIGSFEIVRQARAAISPPNWRDYLTVTPPPEPPPTWMPPRTAEEQAHWDVSYKAGLETGILQARSAFDDGIARLDRDFTGMRRYHALADQGAVSLPVVKTKPTGARISRDGQSAIAGGRAVALVVSPKFQHTASAAPRE